jgi:hypothetical protein
LAQADRYLGIFHQNNVPECNFLNKKKFLGDKHKCVLVFGGHKSSSSSAEQNFSAVSGHGFDELPRDVLRPVAQILDVAVALPGPGQEQGCQIFLGTTYPKKRGKIYRMATKYAEWP